MISDFLKAFADTPIKHEADYVMDNIIVCPSNTNLIYNVIFVKSTIPFLSDSMYSDKDIQSLFNKSLNKAIQNIVFYSCEYIYNCRGESFKLSMSFEEMRLYQKKKVFFHNTLTKDKKLYDDVLEYIASAGSDGRTLNEVSYRFFRNHRNKQQLIINQLEESGQVMITKLKGLHNKPKTVFIALEK